MAYKNTEDAKEWRLRNKETCNARARKWYLDNKEKAQERTLLWQKDNKARTNAKNSKNRASKLKRTPSWLNNSDLILIENFYKIAKRVSDETGTEHHVDHDIPLLGEKVSGLHVPLNLRLLTRSQNCSKSNRYEL